MNFPKQAVAIASVLVGACAGNPQPSKRVAARPGLAEGIGCLDTLRASDSITTILKLSVVPRQPGDTLPSDFENLFAEEFRRRFSLPPKMGLSVVMGVPPCDSLGSRCVAGVLDAGAYAYATAHDNGSLSDIAMLDIALSRSFVDSVKSALDGISRGSLVPPLGGADSVPLIIQLQSEEQPDSIPSYRQILRLKRPRYDLPFAYASMPAAGVSPRYPLTARLAGLGDTVTVAFTIEPDGLIPAESIELVHASYREFVASVANALLDTRYHPARLGDCAVATRMEQRFFFKAPQ